MIDEETRKLTVEDFYKAREALRKANVPTPYFYFVDGKIVELKDLPKVIDQ